MAYLTNIMSHNEVFMANYHLTELTVWNLYVLPMDSLDINLRDNYIIRCPKLIKNNVFNSFRTEF